MSRCFPFPPPGYEKKASADDVDFLKKEKQKEKKHKKEKKDKEKGENEEKKEDRSDGKHKDKKDKKEKHKDKKKEKDRDKEKDKSNNSEKKFPAHPEVQNGENTADEKKLPGKSKGHSWEKHIPKEKGRDKDRSSFSSEKKLGGQFSGYNGEKVSHNSHLAEEFEDAKFVQELGRRVRDEGAGAGNRSVEKFMGTEPKRDEGMVGLVTKTATAFIEEKEKNERSDDMKLDVPGIRNERRPGGNGMVQNIAGAVNARLEVVPIRVESNTERRDEWKEKTKEKGSDGKMRDKRKDKDREKEGHGKDKDRDKEEKKRRKEEKAKAKAKAEHRNLESDNLKGSNKDVPVGTNNLKASDSSKEGNECGVVEENFRKRKDCRKNGFFHVNNVKPNKLLKTTSSLLTDNGRTLEPCQAPIPLASNSHRAETDLMVDAKEHKLNGTNEAQLSDISSPTKQLSSTVSPTKHILASAQASQVDVVSTRTPHPDSKYLSQVLSVPGMEEWLDFDDQSWLFHSNEYQSKKPKVGFSHIDEAQQVWAEALQLGSADVCALPYVIPY